jgi:hypothetical protein
VTPPLCSDGTREHTWLDQRPERAVNGMVTTIGHERCALCGAMRFTYGDTVRYGRGDA